MPGLAGRTIMTSVSVGSMHDGWTAHMCGRCNRTPVRRRRSVPVRHGSAHPRGWHV